MTTPIADMVAELGAKGASIDTIVVAVRAVEMSAHVGRTSADSRQTNADRRRERDRLAKQKKRENARLLKQQASPCAAAVNADLSADASADKADMRPLSILSSLEISQGNSKEEQKEVVALPVEEPRARVKRGTRLPDDWHPSAADMAFATGRGLRLVEIEIEATKFRNYWTNRTDKQAAKLDWSKAWQNWILNVKGSHRERPNHRGAAGAAGPAQTHGDAILAGMARVAARRYGGQPPTGTGPVSGRDDAASRQDADSGSAGRDQPPLLELTANPR